MNYKTCTGPCGQTLPATTEFFHRKKTGKFGLYADCRECRNAHRKRNYYDNHERELARQKQRHKNDPVIILLCKVRCRAKKKNLDFDLTLDWIQEKFDKGVCEVTGWKFVYNVYGEGRNPFTPSIDRIDSNKGYTQNNCQMVVWMYNRAKSDFGLDLFYKMCQAVVKVG